MIKKLRLDNFRRHAQVELDFETDAQIILIAGSNGAGKSTLLEAITYALYGQGRHGRKNLDKLVRRGAELEGMEVELEFEVASSTYRVVRRRDNGLSTAVLSTDARQIAVGADQVTSEISKILGMDAVGFKLATTAQQKELDGLAKLGPSVRAQQIRRLLRLDALTAASDEARATFRRERDIANTLALAVDFPTLEKTAKECQLKVSGAREALGLSNDALVEFDAELQSSQNIDTLWHEANLALARAAGAKENAEAEARRLKQELSNIVVPVEVEAPTESLSELTNRISEVERALAQAENAKQLLAQRDLLKNEISKIDSSQNALKTEIDAITENSSVKIEADLEKVTSLIGSLERKREQARQKLSDATARLKIAQDHLEKASELTATCSLCGQVVSEEHRSNELKFAKLQLMSIKKEVDALTAELAEATTKLGEANIKNDTLNRQLTEAHNTERARERAQAEMAELERRRETYTAQFERIQVTDVDIDELYARKAELGIMVSSAQQAADQARVRAAVLTRQADLRDALDAAEKRLSDAEQLLVDAELDEALKEAYEARAELSLKKEEETALNNHLKTVVAVSEKELENAQKQLQNAKDNEEKRRKHQDKAVAAANASRLLKDVADRLASQIRPALEGSVSQLISTLSEGRFTSVKIDADYNIRVEDDGTYQPMSEFSGGEMDLIALAMRLALAQIVTERHGAGGSGFLILDEVFGSQDDERREAILSALRALKSSYGQILLISHVGGLDEAADLVIDVTRNAEGPSEVRSSQ